MKRHIPNHHDKIVKESFSRPEIAKAYFNEFLPEELKNVIDIQSLTYIDGSYIQEEFSEFFSDLLFQFKVKNSDENLIVSLLFEHKSYPDSMVLVQVGHYIFSQWIKEIKGKQKLVPIIPFIYYQGSKKWEIPSLVEIFKAYPDEIQRYIPSYDYLFFAIRSLTKQQLENITDIMLQLTLIGHDRNQDLFEFLKKIDKILVLRHFDSEDWNYFSLFIVYKLTVSDIPKEEVKSVITALPKPYNDHIMSTYEAIRQEGIEKGEQIGIQKGEQIGIQKGEQIGIQKEKVIVILNSFKNGIDISLIANITNLSEDEVKVILKEHGIF